MHTNSRNTILLAVLLSALLHVGCTSKKEANPQELVSWVENPDRGCIKEKVIKNIGFRVAYTPTPYMAIKENGGNLTPENYQEALDRLTGLTHFNLTIFPSDGSSQDLLHYQTANMRQYQEKIYYYSFPFQKDIYLVQGADTLPCALYHFARDHGLSPQIQFALAFEQRNSKQDMQLVINEKVFGSGPLHFLIEQEAIEGIPSLKI